MEVGHKHSPLEQEPIQLPYPSPVAGFITLMKEGSIKTLCIQLRETIRVSDSLTKKSLLEFKKRVAIDHLSLWLALGCLLIIIIIAKATLFH